MSKRNRKPTKKVDEAKDFRSGGPEREGATRRPYDPNYRNCTFDQATFGEQLARLYNEETIAHLAITRRSESNGDGHLPQPVIREANGTQLAVEALLRGTERQFNSINEAISEKIPTPPPSETHHPELSEDGFGFVFLRSRLLSAETITPFQEQIGSDFIPPFKRGGWKIVEL